MARTHKHRTHRWSRLVVVAGLVITCLGLTGPAVSSGGTGAGWAASGPGVLEVSDGSTTSPSFRYRTMSTGNWLLLRTATAKETVTLPWAWTGDHGANRVRSSLAVGFYRGTAFESVKVLVDDGPRDITGPTEFRYRGKVTLTVNPGDVYGFRLGASRKEQPGELRGRFVLPAPPVLTVPDRPVLAWSADGDGAVVTFPTSASDEVDGAVPVQCAPASGSRFPLGETQVTCSATSSTQQSVSASFPVRVLVDQPNIAWPKAELMGGADRRSGELRSVDQALWYRFPVQPDSVVEVSLTKLAANYDLTLFGDIGEAFDRALTPRDLNQLTAEFAADAYSPSAFSPSAFSPSAFSPSAFSPSAFSPSAFSPSAFSPSAFSPSAFSPSAFSPAVHLPSAFSPSAFSPSAFSDTELAQAFSSAQVRSLIAASARDGLADEHIRVNTWGASGYFYVRVQGRNGVFASGSPFELSTSTSGGPCAAPLDDHASAPTYRGTPGTVRTVVLTDSARLPGAPLEELEKFAERTDIDGIVVDAATIPRVQQLQAQADRLTACAHAKNLVAQELREVVNSFRDGAGTLQYVVIAGDDHVVPFFRSTDAAGLGPEEGYVPPVADHTSSQAALRRNQVLSQDAYGALTDVTLKGASVPIPDLAVGRLVETPVEITEALERYAELDGALPTPRSALVTGYDFLTDAADEVAGELALGLGSKEATDRLITDRHVPPSTTTVGGVPDRAHSWTADDLRAALRKRHDVLFLAGHFSANNALAADHRSTLTTTEVAGDQQIDLADTLVMSIGCHSGYNIVDEHGVPHLTEGLDWPQLMAREGAVLIGGTGYQYGDTDLLEYSERLYAEVTRQLRVGNGAVAVGEALLRAKQHYLASTPVLSGIHQKSLLEAALYGLPMMGVDLPSGRGPEPAPGTAAPVPVAGGPGAVLGLRSLDLRAGGATLKTQKFDDRDATGLTKFTYLAGPDGTTTAPGQPALPLDEVDVGAPGVALRGVAFRGGTYTDMPGVVPLTGAPTTDSSEVHTAFRSPVFFPRRLAVQNTFGALAGDGGTRLLVTAAQHRSEPGHTSTLRRYSSLDLRLLYSGNTEQYGGNRPALAAPPAISGIVSRVDGDMVELSARVVGDPSAGIQEVWVTRTAERGPWYGSWSSVDLSQDPDDSTRWTGSMVLPAGQAAEDVRFVVQAANGVGLVTVEDNEGYEFVPGVDPAGGQPPGTGENSLTLAAPQTAVLGERLPVSATLSAGGEPVAGRAVRFSLGTATATASTDSAGVARASFPVVERPGQQLLSATFDGDPSLRPATDRRAVTVTKRPTALALTAKAQRVHPGADTEITAALTAGPVPVADRSVLLVVRDAGGTVVAAAVRRTGPDGESELGALPLPAGRLSVTGYFGQEGVEVQDGRTAGSVDPDNAAATSAPVVLEVADGAPTVVTTAFPDATAGEAYAAQLEVTGSPEPEVVVEGLPEGLRYDAGAIAGVPTVAGTFDVKVVATNKWGVTTRVLPLVVAPGPPPTIATTTLPDARADVAYTAQLEVTGSPEPEVVVEGLPEGLRYDAGAIAGVPTVAGTFDVKVVATNKWGVTTRVLPLVVAPGPPPTIATTTLPDARADVAYTAQLEVTGWPEPEVVVEGLPERLRYDAGVIVGVPTVAGTFDVKVVATNKWGVSTRVLPLVVAPGAPPTIATTTLPDATAGTEYTADIEVIGKPTPTVTVTGLPEGFRYEGGAIAGVSTTAAESRLTVVASNTWGEVTRVLDLRVVPGAPAQVTAVSGSDQGAVHGTAFRQPLVALVLDAYGNPVPGAEVTFGPQETGTVPGPEAAVTATTDEGGQASATLKAGSKIGSYDVTASVKDVSGGAVFARLVNEYLLELVLEPEQFSGTVWNTNDDGEVEAKSTDAALLTVQVKHKGKSIDDEMALDMVRECQVKLVQDPPPPPAGSLRDCLVYDPVNKRFATQVSGALLGWESGGRYVLRVEVTDAAGVIVGRRKVVVVVNG